MLTILLIMYRTLTAASEFFVEHEIKRSNFLCFIRRTSSEAAAREMITELRQRYPDARHHCSAFIIHQANATPIERSNDDGEPSGTAGIPMLDVLRGSGLMDITAVVVRYFGGTKLGAGGLVHAYSQAVSDCLQQASIVQRECHQLYSIALGHADAGRQEAELRARNVQVYNLEYGAAVTLTLAVPPGQYDYVADTVAAVTKGQSELHEAGQDWVEMPYNEVL